MANMKYIILLSCIMLLLLPRDSVGAKGKVAVDAKGKVAAGAKDKAVKDSQDSDSLSSSSSSAAERSSENKGKKSVDAFEMSRISQSEILDKIISNTFTIKNAPMIKTYLLEIGKNERAIIQENITECIQLPIQPFNLSCI